MDSTLDFDMSNLNSFLYKNPIMLPQINNSNILDVPDDKNQLMTDIFFNKQNQEQSQPKDNMMKRVRIEEEIKRQEQRSEKCDSLSDEDFFYLGALDLDPKFLAQYKAIKDGSVDLYE